MRRAPLLLLTVCALHAQVDSAEVERIALTELKSAGIPGAAIGVVQDRKLVLAKGYGVSSADTGAPVTPEMLFRLGSTTKMLTAATVASLVVEGKIDLDAPVGKYLTGIDPAIAKLTTNQTMSHTSGLFDEAIMFGRMEESALGDTIKTWKADRLFTGPGKIYSYSNPGFRLAGYVAEVVSGKLYADVLKERVFEPLSMKRSTPRPLLAVTWPFSQGHENGGVLRPMAENAIGWPAGSVYSNVEELSRFTIAMMNDGKIEEKQALSPKVIALLTSPHASIPNSKAKYGYGLQLDDSSGQMIWAHGGSRAGYGSFIQMVPGRQIAVIVLCNKTGANLPRTRQAILRMLGVKTTDPREPKAAAAITAAEAAKYAGVYRNANEIRLTVRNGKLFAPGGEVRKREDGMLVVGPRMFYPVTNAEGKVEYLFSGGRALARVP